VRRAVVLLVALALLSALVAAAARAGTPAVDARAFTVVDARTGDVLASSDADEPMPIASITKLMTVIVTLHHKQLGDVVRVDPRAAAVGEESIFLDAGDELTVRDLLEGTLIQSANDAADALALSVAPSFPAFAALMNAEGQKLGLRHTHFVRPDGLDAPGEYSTAADVTKLARDAMRIPIVRQIVQMPTATIAGGQVLHTWDDLLGVFPGVIGGKTGHTDDAGWCQVIAARHGGATVYVTMLGSPSRSVRNAGLEALLAWGLAQFRVVPAIDPARSYATVRLPYGRAALRLVPASGLNAEARVGHGLTEHVVAPAAVSLPVTKGEVLGRVTVYDGEHVIGSRALVADRAVKRPGIAGRVRFYGSRTLHHLAGWITP
jgi:D-alanyl-D-alanine carboxypeptidase (penicillin-binding protein 5/6)